MKKIHLLLLLFTSLSFSQTSEKKHADEKNGYTLEIPSWLTERNPNTPNFFGGTMPKVKEIENAIVVIAFEKSKFQSFEDFQRIYITGNKFGQPTLFSKEQTWYGTNERDFKKVENGVSSKVFIFFKNKIYHHQFVLLETYKSYLLIDFSSTPETFEENLPKFNEFLKGLTVN